METYLAWIVAGFVLVIVELLTGTFYLLVIGVGAFAGAAIAMNPTRSAQRHPPDIAPLALATWVMPAVGRLAIVKAVEILEHVCYDFC